MAISADLFDSYSSVAECCLLRASAVECDVTAAGVRPVHREGSEYSARRFTDATNVRRISFSSPPQRANCAST
jgi:hypothetical protein